MAASKKTKPAAEALEDIPEYVPELPEAKEKSERNIPRRMQIIKQMLVSGYGLHEINRELKRVDPSWPAIDKNLLYYYRTRPDVVAAVAKANANALRYGIANKVRRIAGYDRLLNKIFDTMDAVGESMKNDPGGIDGLLTKETKLIGKGEDAREVTVYRWNKGIIDSVLEVKKQAAIELGQWTEKRDVVSDGKPIANMTREEIAAEAAAIEKRLINRLSGKTDAPADSG